jgi:hypothetical protein
VLPQPEINSNPAPTDQVESRCRIDITPR